MYFILKRFVLGEKNYKNAGYPMSSHTGFPVFGLAGDPVHPYNI